ncbi:MAG: hypothetical protein AAF745_08910 [Planctomycetota bacterium]
MSSRPTQQTRSSDNQAGESHAGECHGTQRTGGRWSFRLLAILLGVLPFLLAEVILRALRQPATTLADDPIFDGSAVAPLFVRSTDQQRYEIPESRSNFFRPASFVVNKPSSTRRIFVLGGSTVQGRPYATETALAKWLQLRLAAADPDHDYEVVNCGGVSYASYRLKFVLAEVLEHAPDAIVIYTGHNEFLEERSYDTISIAGDRGIAQTLASRSELVQQTKRLLNRLSGNQLDQQFDQQFDQQRQRLPSEVVTRLDIKNGMQRFVRDRVWREGVVEHFKQSLSQMLLACQSRSVPVIVCQPASDIVNTPPLKILSADLDQKDTARFEDLYARATNAATDLQQRLISCRGCLAIDPEHAGAHFIAGTLLWQSGKTSQAKFHLIAARDHDVCPLRATTAIEQAIESVSRSYETIVVPWQTWIDRHDDRGRSLPDGVADPQDFLDHVHPSISAHQRLGQQLAKQMESVFAIEPPKDADAIYQRLAKEHLATLQEDYFIRGKQRLEGLMLWSQGRSGKLATD